MFRLAGFLRGFRFRVKQFDVPVSITGGKLVAAPVPAPVKGEDFGVVHVDVGDGVGGTSEIADGRGTISLYISVSMNKKTRK